MQQKKIIILIVGLFLLSSIYLFYSSAKVVDPNYQKNFWSVYFSHPKSIDFNFVIENHSDNTNFHWEAFDGKDGKEKVTEGDLMIKKGESRKLDINSKVGGVEKSIFIRVTSGDEKREIYKNFKTK